MCVVVIIIATVQELSSIESFLGNGGSSTILRLYKILDFIFDPRFFL